MNKHLSLIEPVIRQDLAELREIRRQDAQRRMERDASQARIPKRYVGLTLDDYQINHPAQFQAKSACEAYAKQFNWVLELGGNMLLLGGPGTGKTHLACAILQHIQARGFHGIYTTHENLRAHLRASYDDDAEQRERDATAAFIRPELLVIDELESAKGQPDTIRKDLIAILGERWNESRPTILISNMTVKAAKLYLSPKVWDRVAGTSHHSLLIELWLNSYRNPYA